MTTPSDSPSPEIPLSGGTLNTVVRVGDTVRRPYSPWTPSVQALLGHLRSAGFSLGPAPLGTDDQGREVVSWIEGATLGWALPWPSVVRSDSLLMAVGSALASLHRASASFVAPDDAVWQSSGGGPVYCHNDLAPYNVVLSDLGSDVVGPGLGGSDLVGIIDWDQAGPGDPISDLAFVAWQWVPMHGPFVTQLMGWDAPPDRARRLRLLLDAYGLTDRTGFVAAIAARIELNRSVMLSRAAAGDAAYQALVDQGHVGGMDEALAALAMDGPALQAAIEG